MDSNSNIINKIYKKCLMATKNETHAEQILDLICKLQQDEKTIKLKKLLFKILLYMHKIFSHQFNTINIENMHFHELANKYGVLKNKHLVDSKEYNGVKYALLVLHGLPTTLSKDLYLLYLSLNNKIEIPTIEIKILLEPFIQLKELFENKEIIMFDEIEINIKLIKELYEYIVTCHIK